jgi:SAM-dependent methyltransferase
MSLSNSALRDESSWRVVYPENCIRYIEAFRRHYWDHAGVTRNLHDFFGARGGVKSICELGSGAGTNLTHLSDFGYECTGYDANEESISLSQSRAVNSGRNIGFSLLDFAQELPGRQFDAVVSLFVPISLEDMRSLAERAHSIIRPGGFFACMLLAVEPEFEKVPAKTVSTTEHLEVDDATVLRFNFFDKQNDQIAFRGIYLVNEAGHLRMFKDTDRYDLLTSSRDFALNPSRYQHELRQRVFGKPDQAPPMTYEVIDIYRKLG